MRKTLLLFTGSYPYDVAAENGFIPQELDVLRNYFDKVIVIPTAMGGAVDAIAAPNVVVNTAFATYRRSRLRRAAYTLRCVVDVRFAKEVLANAGMFLRAPRALLSALRQCVISRMTERWVRGLDGVRWADSVLYTWWFDGTTLGLATFGDSADVPVITRAHGSDLYETRHRPPYIPFRGPSLERVKLVFSASEAGARHLAKTYPHQRDKVRVSLLGVGEAPFLNKASTDAVFRIVSCSFCLPVKRIDLLIKGIAALGRSEPRRRFQWTHIGDGPEKASLMSLARSVMPENVRHEMLSYPGKTEGGLLEYYRTQPIDLFVNTSESEGTPVTIMEAISVGIPVMATAVGGNTEIVTEENGVAIPADPDPAEIADAIRCLMLDDTRLARLREGSKDKWQREYSAAQNYANFAAAIREL